jgi:hypothetical protein
MSETTQLTPSPATLAAEVAPAEYARLLGLPRGRPLEGLILERAEAARAWYAERGRPFAAARRVGLARLTGDGIVLEEGGELTCGVLARRLRDGAAHALLALAVSAGVEVDAEAGRLWAEGKPDEAYFLERFGTAVVERLVFHSALALCRAAEARQETLLPHLSPGCGSWDLGDQPKLMRLVFGGAADAMGRMEMLPTGALRPKNALLAALGVTHRRVAPSPADACRACDLPGCGFRRAPYAAPRADSAEATAGGRG